MKMVATIAAALMVSFTAAGQAADVLLVIDSSGSMKLPTSDGVTRIDAAREALRKLGSSLSGDEVGVILFGHRAFPNQDGACEDIEVVQPIGTTDAKRFNAIVDGLRPRGNTPLASSLLVAADALVDRNRDTRKEIILVTDGNETCGGNPIEVADRLAKLGINVRVHVVGFAVQEREEVQLKAIASAGGGNYVKAENAADLKKALPEVVANTKTVEVAAPVAKPEPIFLEEFDGEGLGEDWKVLQADTDSFIVEDGELLVVHSGRALLTRENVPNIFRLERDMPKGDWTATMKVTLDMQTGRETIVFGLYGDKDTNLMAAASGYCYYSNGANAGLNLDAFKTSKGKGTNFTKNLWAESTGKITSVGDQAAQFPNEMLLRVAKKGRSYHVSARMTDRKGRVGEWVELEKLTSIRSPGKLAFALFQRDHTNRSKANGESTMLVDWVRIDAN